MHRWMDGWKLNNLETMEQWKKNADLVGFSTADFTDITKNVMRTVRIMLAWSLFSIHWHILDKFFEIRDYPNDALWYQYWAVKKNLAKYGIFWATK